MAKDIEAMTEDEMTDYTIVTSQRLDPFTVKNRRVILSPAICTVAECGYDFLRANKMKGSWEKLTVTDKQKVRDAMKAHARKHEAEQASLVRREDVPKQWPPKPTSEVPTTIVVE